MTATLVSTGQTGGSVSFLAWMCTSHKTITHITPWRISGPDPSMRWGQARYVRLLPTTRTQLTLDFHISSPPLKKRLKEREKKVKKGEKIPKGLMIIPPYMKISR